MVRVVVAGATGKLGSLVVNLLANQKDVQLVGCVVSQNGGHVGKDIAIGIKACGPDELPRLLKEADVYVELTPANAAEANLKAVLASGVPCVIGSTGLSEQYLNDLREGMSRSGSSAVQTANFSIGVNVFWKACEQLARSLPEYEVEIIELHHDKKRDAPSGTALKAAQVITSVTGVDKYVCGREGVTGARGREIGIHAVRIGDVVGEHTVIFSANKERIELTHRAHSREAFAEGCVTAVRWIAGRKDGKVHSMAEVLGL